MSSQACGGAARSLGLGWGEGDNSRSVFFFCGCLPGHTYKGASICKTGGSICPDVQGIIKYGYLYVISICSICMTIKIMLHTYSLWYKYDGILNLHGQIRGNDAYSE